MTAGLQTKICTDDVLNRKHEQPLNCNIQQQMHSLHIRTFYRNTKACYSSVLISENLFCMYLNMVEDIQVVQAVGNLTVGQLVGKTSQSLMIFLNQLMFYLCNLKRNEVLGFEVLMAVKKKSMVFWVETLI